VYTHTHILKGSTKEREKGEGDRTWIGLPRRSKVAFIAHHSMFKVLVFFFCVVCCVTPTLLWVWEVESCPYKNTESPPRLPLYFRTLDGACDEQKKTPSAAQHVFAGTYTCAAHIREEQDAQKESAHYFLACLFSWCVDFGFVNSPR
jgi:hypothetical protein